METVTISKFKATCLALIDRVNETGEPLLITRRGEPVAEVSAVSKKPRKKRQLGYDRGSVKILGDIVSPACPQDEWEVLKD